MNEIKNIYCVGRNYVNHAKELNNDVPTKPLLFSKPNRSLAKADGKEIMLQEDKGAVHYEAELVVRLGKPYEKGIKVNEIVDSMALGLDLTLRDVQSELKKKGHPWLMAKGFPNAAVISDFIPFPGEEKCKEKNFALIKNGEQVQLGNIKQMIFDLQTLVDYCGTHLGTGEGDIIFTGTPEGVGPIVDGDHMELVWDGDPLGECKFRQG
ncbi:2-keto-4-pentenoate hydratase/2-oxohepta-3-ene-1,7-dioic acid hydratase (catechol pathway) [Thalassobacillus cyri]|uniref:2-keto-4-pentenoate hydratase/2-oxohepta-3-ene-1,7-dioic acid hydratase (Catechol pathway) n=1 Tax=Thalassobacillus cyri TaxID=571932 RepID=A0A1H4DKJ5_9BACI|nr:fumarylacetoacetate hydrolase family protein [Thalassobacillus cyri]SEA73107.1 2-keto-4-pentenoate hydratase/2-oxohepta-3-ene-1,7-dioic acid hydratase (catechol pathway) [Thalassobacillus cyri]